MKKIILTLITFFSIAQLTNAQEFMMQGWYWDYFKQNNGVDRWATHLQKKASELKNAGFTYVWLPPATRTSTPNDTTNGYNPRDLYDYGNNINGQPRPTMLGTRAELNALITAFNSNNIKAVADLVYNHRDGGKLEVNPAVKTYTNNLNSNKDPFPCDRLVLALPLGALNPGANGAGDYYFKFSSKTGNYGTSYRYNLYMRTSKTSNYLGTVDEVEPNGGGDCGTPANNNVIQLGQDMRAYLGVVNNCGTDEFKLTLTNTDMKDNGTTRDTLWIYMRPLEGGYADQRPYGIWSAARSTDVVNELLWMTYTDYSNLPSGKGQMNFESFRPNTANATTETLRGDWNSMLFFYDYDQSNSTTINVLNDWTRWNWDTIGIRGFRWDAVKHFSTGFISQLINNLNANGINPGMVVGESYDGNASVLKGWVDGVKSGMTTSALANIKPKVFDFALRGALREACDNGFYDVRNVFSSGVVDAAGGSGFDAVTFINNHDFRSSSGWDAPIQNNPILAYAYILTNNKIGVPCVFYPDYYGVPYPNAPTAVLKPQIDKLMDIHKKHIFGASQVEYLNKEGSFYQTATGNYISSNKTEALIYQIKGGASGRDVIVAINFGDIPLRVDHVINTSGSPVGTRFYDQLGYSAFPFATVNASGKIYIDLPAKSYSVWVKDIPPILNAKVFLNNVDAATGLMPDALRTKANFPLTDPYLVAPFNTTFTHVNNPNTNVTTTSTVLSTTGNNAIVDWVFVELRQGTSGATTVAGTKVGLLQRDGDIVDVDGVSPLTFNNITLGNYYVAIRHRNHLGFRTNAPVTFANTTAVNVNFTDGSVAVFGANALVDIPNSTYKAMRGGNAEPNATINLNDFNAWSADNGFYNDYTKHTDFNLDGEVNTNDYLLWKSNNGFSQQLD